MPCVYRTWCKHSKGWWLDNCTRTVQLYPPLFTLNAARQTFLKMMRAHHLETCPFPIFFSFLTFLRFILSLSFFLSKMQRQWITRERASATGREKSEQKSVCARPFGLHPRDRGLIIASRRRLCGGFWRRRGERVNYFGYARRSRARCCARGKRARERYGVD